MAKQQTKKQPADRPVSTPKAGVSNGLWVLLILVILVSIFIRIRMAGIPLERDEGDYATNAMLLLDGVSLSSDLIMKRFTLIYYLYMGFLSLFGQSDTGIHMGLMVFNMASIGGMYLLGREWKGPRTGVLAAIMFTILSLSYTVNGLNANREPFLVFFAIFGIWFLLKALKQQVWWQYLVAGLIMGASFAVKQHGAFYLLFGGLWLLYFDFFQNKTSIPKVIGHATLYSLGGLFLFGLIMLQYKLAGAFEGFFENTFQSNVQYVQARTPAEGWQEFSKNFGAIFNKNAIILLLGIPGLIYGFTKKQWQQSGVFLLLLLVLTFLSTVPGWYFRPHYFMLTVPVIGLLAANGINGVRFFLSKRSAPQVKSWVASALVLLAVVQPLAAQAHYFFEADDVEASRIVYQHNPFPEAEVMGDYIQRISNPGDKIMVLGSEPEIYFYANRHPAISSYYMYHLMRPTERASQRQQELIQKAEQHPPEIIVFYDMTVSWAKTKASDRAIFEWFNEFARNYQMVGKVDILHEETNYVFGPQAANYQPRSSAKAFILKKR